MIASLSNFKVKHVVKLRENAKFRRESGVTVVDGAAEIRRALESGVAVQEVFVCADFIKDPAANALVQRLIRQRVTVHDVSCRVAEKISYGQRQEGLIALARPVLKTFQDLPADPGKPDLFVVLEHVEKPGNLGAILRTCGAADVDALIVCDPKTDIFNPNVIRASLASVFSVPVVCSTNEEALAFLQSRCAQCLAAVPVSPLSYFEADFQKSTAIVLGAEHTGLSDFWQTHSRGRVSIPMSGKVDSLNVSVAAAVLIYEALRQRS